MEKKSQEIYIYDAIGTPGISAKMFIEKFYQTRESIIHIRINSPGGDVFEGLAIYNVIKEHKGKVIAYIEGMAGGIASIIPLAADEVTMKKDALFMICNPAQPIADSDEEIQKTKDTLDKVTDVLAKIYAGVFKKSDREVKILMFGETWFTAQEALDAGFINSIYE